jgi:hypothetical protein
VSERPHVVVLNPDPAEASAWERALSSFTTVRTVHDEAQLSAALGLRCPDVLVAPCDAGLLEGIQRVRGPSRLVLCGPTLPEGVLDLAGEGTDLRQVAGPEQLRRAVLALARPRSTQGRQPVEGLTLSFGEERSARVLDLSSRGLSFRIEPTRALEPFLPGEELRALHLRRGLEVVLEAEAARVRYVERARDEAGAPFYKVGCELLPPRPQGAGPSTRIDDHATCAGLLRQALRKEGLLLQPEGDELDGQIIERGELDLERGLLQLQVASHGFSAHDVVRGTFELGGSSYRFLASVVQEKPLVLKAPASIEATHRRGAARHRPSQRRPIKVQLSSALWPAPLRELPALEISATGLSLAIDPVRDLLPAGLKLRAIELDLGEGERLRFQGEVRSLSPIPDGSGALRAGISFTGLTEEGRGQLADALMRHRIPGLCDAGDFAFDDLWTFLEATGFLYPNKMETLAPLLPRVRETFSALSRQSGKLYKAVVFQEEIQGEVQGEGHGEGEQRGARPGAAQRQILAHISAVRSHSRSFVVQHLAALPRLKGGQGPRAVNLGITDFLAQDQHLEFGKSYFRPDNKWPARVFGGYARRVTDKQRSDLRTHDYLVYPTTLELPAPEGIRVIEARGRDLGIVEGFFVARERGCILRSDDLTRSALELEAVNEAYQEAGLSRRRVVLLALRRDEPVGFALCEVSSPGLNLSELLSSMQLHLLPGLDPRSPPAQEIRSALMQAAFGVYARSERPFVPVLKDARDPDPLPVEPLERKHYSCWTWHKSLLRPFNEYVERMYELLESSLARRSQRQAQKGLTRPPEAST